MGKKKSKLKLNSSSPTYKYIYMRGYNAGKRAGTVRYEYRANKKKPSWDAHNGAITISTLLSPPTGF